MNKEYWIRPYKKGYYLLYERVIGHTSGKPIGVPGKYSVDDHIDHLKKMNVKSKQISKQYCDETIYRKITRELEIYNVLQ